MTTGTISGKIASNRTLVLALFVRRLMPSAPSVPTTVAMAAAQLPIMALFTTAERHFGEAMASAYQWVERPGKGNAIIVPEEKDTGITIKAGATSKTSTTKVNPRK